MKESAFWALVNQRSLGNTNVNVVFSNGVEKLVDMKFHKRRQKAQSSPVWLHTDYITNTDNKRGILELLYFILTSL